MKRVIVLFLAFLFIFDYIGYSKDKKFISPKKDYSIMIPSDWEVVTDKSKLNRIANMFPNKREVPEVYISVSNTEFFGIILRRDEKSDNYDEIKTKVNLAKEFTENLSRSKNLKIYESKIDSINNQYIWYHISEAPDKSININVVTATKNYFLKFQFTTVNYTIFKKMENTFKKIINSIKIKNI